MIRQEKPMSVAKVIEISSQHPKSFEEAIRQGIQRASETISGIKGAWVSEQQVEIRDGKVTGYRVNLRVTFVLEAAAKPKKR
jgi:flavin-binding protein dodecin